MQLLQPVTFASENWLSFYTPQTWKTTLHLPKRTKEEVADVTSDAITVTIWTHSNELPTEGERGLCNI